VYDCGGIYEGEIERERECGREMETGDVKVFIWPHKEIFKQTRQGIRFEVFRHRWYLGLVISIFSIYCWL
jgi:hypothetical protein